MGGLAVASAVGFTAGYALAPSKGRETASALRAVAAGATARCSSHAFRADLDPEGKLTLLEYTTYSDDHPKPVPTGRVLAYVDALTRQLNRDCTTIRSRPLRPRGLVGPYARSPQSRVYCGNNVIGLGPPTRFVDVQVRPVLDQRGRMIGNRLIATLNAEPVVNAFVTRRGGGISFQPLEGRCLRNPEYGPYP